MKVILLQNINGLGQKYDIKDVKGGYVRNFLLPKKLVAIATLAALTRLSREKAILEERRSELTLKLKEEAEKIEKLTLEFKLKVGEKNEVFGSVTKKDIELALADNGFRELKVELDKPIKSIGEHNVEVDLGEGVKVSVKALITNF